LLRIRLFARLFHEVRHVPPVAHVNAIAKRRAMHCRCARVPAASTSFLLWHMVEASGQRHEVSKELKKVCD
jgi:hypothetical protein